MATNERPELLAQLTLAYNIVLGITSPFALTAHDFWLLQLPQDFAVHTPDDERQVKEAVRDILVETFVGALPPTKIDYRRMAIDFLKQIREAGGLLRPDQVLIPPPLLKQMVSDQLVVISGNGAKWGRMAAEAVRLYGDSADGT